MKEIGPASAARAGRAAAGWMDAERFDAAAGWMDAERFNGAGAHGFAHHFQTLSG